MRGEWGPQAPSRATHWYSPNAVALISVVSVLADDSKHPAVGVQPNERVRSAHEAEFASLRINDL